MVIQIFWKMLGACKAPAEMWPVSLPHGDAEEVLSSKIAGWLEKAVQQGANEGHARAVIAPHAGKCVAYRIYSSYLGEHA